MNRIKTFLQILNKERLYVWMLAFVILCNIAAFIPHKKNHDAQEFETYQLQDKLQKELNTPEKVKALAQKNPAIVALIGLTTSSSMAAIIIGIVFLVRFLLLRRRGVDPLTCHIACQKTSWHLLDVFKVAILFLFYGYGLFIVEAVIFKLINIKVENDMLISAVNTAIMDAAIIYFIYYCVVIKYQNNLLSIGLYFKDIVSDIKLGIVSYITFLPIFVGSLMLVLGVVKIFGLKLPPQPVVELFIKAKNPALLLCLTGFVAVVGPIAEELFFRGFAYNALKRVFSVKVSLVVSALVFAALHTNWAGLVPIACLGFLLGYIYEKRGSIIPSMTIHVIHNVLTMFTLFLFKEIANLI